MNNYSHVDVTIQCPAEERERVETEVDAELPDINIKFEDRYAAYPRASLRAAVVELRSQRDDAETTKAAVARVLKRLFPDDQ